MRFRSDQVRTTHSRPGKRHLLTAPAPSKAIRGVLFKFADLPEEAEVETRNLDEARRRIAGLEQEIRELKNSQSASRTDEAAIERAVKAAVERERAASHDRLEKDRAHLRQMIATLASAGQLIETLQVLVEETQREWSVQTAPEASTFVPQHHRQQSAGRLVVDDPVAATWSNGSLKLSAGERRILTALAQYPAGRGKVQVAVLTGYAANGGGFNNYLGALRSHELIDGNAERLTITETGAHALGSWEPLPKGSALIKYWRNHLGKAERLILEALTQAHPRALAKKEVAAKAGYEANGGGFNNALGRLRTLELVHGRGALRASRRQFPGPGSAFALADAAHSRTPQRRVKLAIPT